MPTLPSKPTANPEWATNLVNVVDPGGAKRTVGWLVEKPPHEFFNYTENAQGQWIRYLEEVTDLLNGILGVWDAIVGSSDAATHATLALALADATIVSDSRILVLDAQALATTVQVSKNGIEIDFHPRATFSNNGAGTALQILGDRVKVRNGRFTGFTVGIEVDASADYTRLVDNSFNTVTTPIDDNASTTVEYGTIVE